MLKGVLVYISGPITPKHGFTVEQNVAEAMKTFNELIRRGIPAFPPQFCAAFPSNFDIEYQVWLEYDFAVLDFCTHMLMLPRWRSSDGAMKEMAYAEKKHIPILFDIGDLLITLGLQQPEGPS